MRQALDQLFADDLEAIRASELFDSDWYLGQYPDVKALSIDPAAHYLWLGSRMGRLPSLRFDADAYVRSNPDVAAAGLNPLLHYIKYGRQQGRPLAAVVGSRDAPHGVKHRSALSLANQGAKDVAHALPWRSRGPKETHAWDASPLISGLAQHDLLTGLDVPDQVLAYAQSLVAKGPPTISVIVPTWNRAKVLRSAIDSALNQSFSPLEIIISDDGSTDGTLELVRDAYPDALRSGLIRIVECAHEGVSAARNAAMKAARGELFAYLDSDNVWTRHFLLLMAAAFAEHDELMTAYTGLHLVDRESGRQAVQATLYDRKQIVDWNHIDLNVFVHRRELYTQFGGFDEALTPLVDWDLILRYTRNYPPAVPCLTLISSRLVSKRSWAMAKNSCDASDLSK